MLNTAFPHDFTFNAVQMPLNVMDTHFNSFEKKVVPVLVKHSIGVLGMKSMGDGLILKSKTAAGRVPALRDELADQRGHHRLRFAAHPATGAESGTHFQAPEPASRSPRFWPEPRRWPKKANGSYTRHPTISTGRIRIRSGWIKEQLALKQIVCHPDPANAGEGSAFLRIGHRTTIPGANSRCRRVSNQIASGKAEVSAAVPPRAPAPFPSCRSAVSSLPSPGARNRFASSPCCRV